MAYYAGLDVSLELTSVCVVDEAGAVVREHRVATEPDAIAAALATLPQAPARVLLETGGLTPWLWHELGARGLVVHCIDARRAKAQLALRPGKTDRNDARGLAEIARMGWHAQVRVKRLDHHALRAKLAARAQLVATARDLGNQLRGLLRTFGLRVGKGKGRAFEERVLTLVAGCLALQPVADALLAARRAVRAEVERLDRVLLREARADAICRRLMTVPGVGPITALAYQSTIEDPMRFGRARDVGAYLGLVPRRHQSGEVDRSGRISKQGDALLRGYLYEAATVLLTRLQRACALRDWGRALADRIGTKKARVALARKLAVRSTICGHTRRISGGRRLERLSDHRVVPAGDAGGRDRGKGGGATPSDTSIRPVFDRHAGASSPERTMTPAATKEPPPLARLKNLF